MKLIIAEKPDMMRKIAYALSSTKITTEKGKMYNSEITFSHALGHLTKLESPEEIDSNLKKWTMDNLPFFFDSIPLVVDKKCSEQFKILKSLLNSKEFDEIINACDADREGELIFRNILQKTGSKTKNISRMWITSTTKEGIQDAYKNRKDFSQYDNIGQSAKARSYADWLIGMNSTRAMTIKFGGYNNLLTVGRVQTPTLRIICDVENEILNFKSKKYYKISADAITRDQISFIGNYYNEDLPSNNFDEKEDALKIINKIGTGKAKVILADSNSRKSKPKLLFSLSDLQIEMNRKYGMSANEVLDYCQKLYEEYSLTTYPRTDENHISEELAKKSSIIINNLSELFPGYTEEIVSNNWKINPIVVAKKNEVGAHEALTPVLGKIDISKVNSLPNKIRLVYEAIVKRFIQAFYPDAVYKIQKVVFEKENEKFICNQEALVVPGYLKVIGKETEDEEFNYIPVNPGDEIEITKLNLIEKETTPPNRFTEGSLIRMMKDPSKYTNGKSEKEILKKAEGIGTEATRAGIIENLKQREYITLKGKNIVPTNKGMEFIKSIPSELIKSVSLTAQFETKLSMIKDGNYSFDSFLNEVKEINSQFIDEVKKSKVEREVTNKMVEKESIAICPHCGGKIILNKFSYNCDSCNVKINKQALEKQFGLKEIKKTDAIQLLKTGKTKKKVKLHSKTKNKDFEAYLTYKYDETKEYPNNVWISFD